MMKRVTWFAGGVLAGAVGSVYAVRKVKAKAETLKPVNVARSAVARTKIRIQDVADAVREGRDAMHDKEDELRAERDGGFEEAEVVSVQPGKVIVLRPSRSGERRRRHA